MRIQAKRFRWLLVWPFGLLVAVGCTERHSENVEGTDTAETDNPTETDGERDTDPDVPDDTQLCLNSDFTVVNEGDGLAIPPPFSCINGDLIIENPTLTGFDLSHISEVKGTVRIRLTGALDDLSGLSGLVTIGGDFELGTAYERGSRGTEQYDCAGNSALRSVTGLSALLSVGGDVVIAGNPLLESLDGLEQLGRVDGDLKILENDTLRSIAALRGLSSVGGSVTFYENEALSSFTGLEGLSVVNDDLDVLEVAGVADFSGFDNVRSVGGVIKLHMNTVLESLSGLDNITEVGAVWAYGNPRLPGCEVCAFVERFDDYPRVTVTSNLEDECLTGCW